MSAQSQPTPPKRSPHRFEAVDSSRNPLALTWNGVKQNLSTHPHQAVKLEAFLDLFLIADFTSDAAIHYAEICAALEAAATSIGPLDLLA